MNIITVVLKFNRKLILLFLLTFSAFLKAEEPSENLSPLINYIINKAECHKQEPSQPIPIIAIAGCGGVGKTYFANLIAQHLEKRGVQCTVLHFDDFLLSQEERRKLGTQWDLNHINLSFGLSSSDSENFAPQIMRFPGEANGQRPFASTESTGDASKIPEGEGEKPKTQVIRCDKLHNVFSQILSKERWIAKPTYDPFKKEIGSEVWDLQGCDLILFEGLYALCTHSPTNFFIYCDSGIFLEADEADIFAWKWNRELQKDLPRSRQQFIEHMEAYLLDFHSTIAYSRKNAIFVIKKDSLHQYFLIPNY